MKITGSTIEQIEKNKPKGKCRKWRLWVTTEEGRKSKRFTGTWTQAQDALSAFVCDLEALVPNKESLGSYAASWARWRAESGELAPGTIANDTRALNAFRRTELFDRKMDEITPEDCREALIWLKNNPVSGSGTLSNTTMNKLHIFLGSAFQQAVNDGKLAKNPMRSTKAPKPDTKEKEALTPERVMEVAESVCALPLDGRVMAVLFMLLLGLRRGEACALYDEDVHDGCAYIKRAIKEQNGAIDEPKSAAGVRTLPMPDVLQEKVDEWRSFRKAIGLGDSKTLCCNTRGGILRPQLLYRWWTGDSWHKGIRNSIGCEDVTMHQLRHSNLSMMARHMSPFDLQRYAGWSSLAPARVYIHDDLDAVTKAVNGAWCGLNAPKTHQ